MLVLVLVLPPAAGASLSLSVSLFVLGSLTELGVPLSHTLVASADSTIRLFCKMSDCVGIVGVVCDDYWVE